MGNCKFLRQKKQVKINGEWVDTRSYRYLPYCDGGTPSVTVTNGSPNGYVYVGYVKYDMSHTSGGDKTKTISLDGNGNGYVEMESDDVIRNIKSSTSSPSSVVEISGCYLSSFGGISYTKIIQIGSDLNYVDAGTLIVSCSKYKTPPSNHRYFFNGTNLIFRGLDLSSVTSVSNMFYFCHHLTHLDLSGFESSHITDMSYMFNTCSGATSLDLSKLNTSNATSMNYMFNNCRSLQTLNISGWDTSNVADMGHMFAGCMNLQSLDLSGLDTHNATSMYCMFRDCRSLKTLDLSNFNTSNVTDMGGMFNNCYEFQSLDLSNFNTSKVTADMIWMFENCSSLQSLNISGWDISNVTAETFRIFGYCPKLKTVYMRGCNQTTIDKIKEALSFSNILNQVTIIT